MADHEHVFDEPWSFMDGPDVLAFLRCSICGEPDGPPKRLGLAQVLDRAMRDGVTGPGPFTHTYQPPDPPEDDD